MEKQMYGRELQKLSLLTGKVKIQICWVSPQPKGKKKIQISLSSSPSLLVLARLLAEMIMGNFLL